MHPRHFAVANPDKPALIVYETGETLTYGTLEKQANKGANYFRSLGLQPGDGVAVILENNAAFFEIFWAAQRCGLYFTPISTRLTAGEAAYIVGDCAAKVLVVSRAAGEAGPALVHGRAQHLAGVTTCLSVGAAVDGANDWGAAIAPFPDTPAEGERAGVHMVYSSGTTGRPKGVRLPLMDVPADTPSLMAEMIKLNYGADETTVYLSPAPVYHAAPLVYTTQLQRIGATIVMMRHFEPEAFLEAVQRYKATMMQMVPTMFVRLLKLPEATRKSYDVSSLQCVIHAAAPCPVPVKHQMIEWWGKIIYEYYAGSEGNGSTFINSDDWLKKPGSVGQARNCVIHICDEEGNELPPGEAGTIFFESESTFTYHNDAEKTASSRHPAHPTWSTLGDIGYLDEDGYLFLTDRKAFMIISGGVNVYPQETENVLVMHPKVADAAVFGVPNEDFGEEVKAVIQPMRWEDVGPELEEELKAFCRANLSPIKCPRSIDFEPELPRHPTGKLYKKPLRDRYWPK